MACAPLNILWRMEGSVEHGENVSVRKRRRIALISLHWAGYGSPLACALAETCDVMLVLYTNNARDELGERWREALWMAHVQVLALEKPRHWPRVLSNARSMVRGLRAFRPHLVHCHEAIRDELLLALMWLRPRPLVLTVHDPRPHSGDDARDVRFSRFPLYHAVVRRLATTAITHGEVLREELAEVCPRLASRTRVVLLGPPGTAVPTIDSAPAGERVLFFGRMNEYRGLRYFVEAVTALRRKGHPIIGLVAGQGPDLERNRTAIEAAGCFEVHDRYIAADEVPKLFAVARAVVLPYIDGTQSGVAAMAIGFGRPVIASRVGSLPELVRHGENGLLIPPRDVRSLVAAIEDVLTDEELANRLAAGARALRDGDLSWRVLATHTIGIYDEAIEQHVRCRRLSLRSPL